MKAAYIEQTGGAGQIQVGELKDPGQPGEGQVRVRVRATAVNPIDCYLRAGMVPMDLPMPYIIGSEMAGEVEAVGQGVRRFKPGDRVWGANQGILGRQGVSAEYVLIDEQWLVRTPDGVADAAASALGVVGVTAVLGLFDKADLQRGETVFVNGGSGGVGSMVVQMAKAAGARVITTAGSKVKAELCKELGADQVILYKEEDVATMIEHGAPRGVDVWYETRREPDLMMAVPLLAPRGRVVLMAGREAQPCFPLGSFYTRDCVIYGLAMFNAPPEQQRAAGERINRWLDEGKLKVIIDRVMPLEDAAKAHELQEGHTLEGKTNVSGKIVLKID